MAVESTPKPAEGWQVILEGTDNDAFRQLVEPYTEGMLRAAQQDLAFYVEQASLHEDDFTPEEIVGETLIHAWEHRDVRPREMGLRAWLLGTQYRVTRGLVNRQRAYRHEKELSLDEPVPTQPDADDAQEWFWDWYQPEKKLLWEDVIPEPDEGDEDVEITLGEDREELLEEFESRHVLLLHDEFEMSVPEIAFTLNRTPVAVADMLEAARAGLARQASETEE